ncbi:MAG: hypothetical protein H0X37_24280 [Herpetosiphonaceae bacterium]|nr:hypothetical protein [Herpetosiphonaceae bacterium]
MRRIFRENGLSLVMFGLFALSFCGQIVTGYRTFNHDQQDHNQPETTLGHYLTSGHFVEATFENWESEFLQMGVYVLLTVFLRQKGAHDSKKFDGPEPVDADPNDARVQPGVPWPVRRGGWILKIYQHSLTLALFGLFALAFSLHALGGAREYNTQQKEHGSEPISTVKFLGTSEFWFQSFQNWQSEFLSIGTLVVLSIFLRQKGSPESKSVASPHSDTGGD